jgi:rhodanese-related sulfurtransferase
MQPFGGGETEMRHARWLAAALCLATFTASADETIPFITTDELKKAFDAKEDLFLADALSPIEFAEERIVGSVNVPYEALHAGKAKLPADKGRKIVFYCKGPKCTKSVQAAGLAVKMGHRNVLVYNEGIPEWMKRGYPTETKKVYPDVEIPALPPEALKRMIDAKQDLVLVDIRDAETFATGRITGSRNIDLEVLDQRLAELPKEKKIVLLDLHGKQTQIAGRFLASKGYREVSRLDGGVVGGWVKAGYPVAR